MTDDPDWEEILGVKDSREFFGDDLPKLHIVETLDFEHILRSAEEQVNKGGWDQPPMMLFLRANDVGAELLQLDMPPDMASNFPQEFGRYVKQLMDYITEFRDKGPYEDHIKSLQNDFLGPAFQAIIVSTEGWSVPEPNPLDVEAWKAWKQAAADGTFHEREDRVETRITALLTTVSDFCVIKRDRESDQIDYLTVPGEDWEWGAQGGVVEMMRIFMRACIALNVLQGLMNEEVKDYWNREYQRAEQWAREHPNGLTGEEPQS